MFILYFYRLFKGFLQVKTIGDYPERIINICYNKRISIWNIKHKDNYITFNLLPTDFKALKKYRSKSGIRLKIVKKTGLPFLISKNKKRFGLVVGLGLFFVILFTLSNFVWNIHVVGNQSLTKQEILDYAKEVGVYEGMPIKRVDSPNMRNRMLLKNDKLSWVSFNLEGLSLTINVSETKRPKKVINNTPCNLVATKDGVIKYLEIKSGYSAVKVGDAVKKGDLLVSGIYELKNGVSQFTYSNGKVFAQTEIIIKKSLPLKQTEKHKYKKTITRHVLNFFGLNIPLYLGSIKGDYIKELSTDCFKSNIGYLPIKLHTAKFTKIENKVVIKTKNSVKKQLKNEVEKQLKKEGIKKIVSLKHSFSYENNKVYINSKAIVLQNIAKKEPIRIGK